MLVAPGATTPPAVPAQAWLVADAAWGAEVTWLLQDRAAIPVSQVTAPTTVPTKSTIKRLADVISAPPSVLTQLRNQFLFVRELSMRSEFGQESTALGQLAFRPSER